MLFAGFNVSEGEYSMFAVVAVGTAANVVGSWIAYAVGYYGRVDILEKHGKKLHIKPSHLAWADRWFEKYGSWTVFLTRMLPIIRTFISLPAGVARMPFWRFTRADRARLHPVDLHAHVHRQAGRRQLGELEGLAALRRLRGRRDDRARARSTWWSATAAAGTRSPRRPGSRPPMRRAEVVALGLIQGPAELLPISSSGHVAALPLLLGWEHASLEGARRKEVEVALHAGRRGRPAGRAAAGADGAAARRRGAVDGADRGAGVPGRALDRGAPGRAGVAGRRPGGGLGGAGARRPAAGAAAGGGRGAARRRAARARPGVRAGARASRARARRWRRRGRSASRGPTRCGSRAGSACP